MWQSSFRGWSQWRVHAFHQYVAPISFPNVSYSLCTDLTDGQTRKHPGQKTGLVTAALYIFSAYSPFEDVLNRYMSEGLPIIPITSMDQLDVVGNSSFASLINGTREIRHIPVEFSLLRDITLLDH